MHVSSSSYDMSQFPSLIYHIKSLESAFLCAQCHGTQSKRVLLQKKTHGKQNAVPHDIQFIRGGGGSTWIRGYVPLDIQFSFPEPGRWRINALAEILKSQCLSPTTIFKQARILTFQNFCLLEVLRTRKKIQEKEEKIFCLALFGDTLL